jgi:hypothetical protein
MFAFSESPIPDPKVSVTLSTSDFTPTNPDGSTPNPSNPASPSPSPPQDDCDGKFRFGSLCGSAAIGAVVGLSIGCAALLAVFGVLGYALVTSSAADSPRVQPIQTDPGAALAPPVTLLAPPSGPYGQATAAAMAREHDGQPWSRSPYGNTASTLRGEPMIWDTAPWRPDYVRAAPTPTALGTGRRSAAVTPLPPSPWRPMDRVAAERRQAPYRAGIAVGPQPAPPPQAVWNPAAGSSRGWQQQPGLGGHGAPGYAAGAGVGPRAVAEAGTRTGDFYSIHMAADGPMGFRISEGPGVVPEGGAGYPPAAAYPTAAAQAPQGVQAPHQPPSTLELLQPWSPNGVDTRGTYLRAARPSPQGRGSGLYLGW